MVNTRLQNRLVKKTVKIVSKIKTIISELEENLEKLDSHFKIYDEELQQIPKEQTFDEIFAPELEQIRLNEINPMISDFGFEMNTDIYGSQKLFDDILGDFYVGTEFSYELFDGKLNTKQ